MAIPLYGSVGALFNRLGVVANLVGNVNAFQATLKASMIDPAAGVTAQYATEPDLQAEIGGGWIQTLAGLEGICGTAQTLAADTLGRMVFRDNALLNQNLTKNSTLASVDEVIRQMGLQGATVLALTVTAVPQVFAGNGQQFSNPEAAPTGPVVPGNAVIVTSVRRAFDGRVLENSFGETLTLTCTADSFTGGATAGAEPYAATGQGGEGDLFAFDWPLGSNCTAGLAAVSGEASAGAGNLLTNSGWETWTGSPAAPANWVVVTGGGLIGKSTGIVYSGAGALLLTGDGATKLQLRQPFGSAAGTAPTLAAQTQYAFNTFARAGGTPPSGTLLVRLVDQNGNVVLDNANTPNQLSFDLATLTTSWTALGGTFRLPTVLPSTVTLEWLTSVAVNNGGQAYFDRGALTPTTQLYTGGPSLALFSGNLPAVAGDYGYVLVTNARGAGGTLNTWQTALYRLLNSVVAPNEVLFPSSSLPTVSDNLIA